MALMMGPTGRGSGVTASSMLPPLLQHRLFNPANPTGSWSLSLSHPVEASVARRLLLAATQQHDLGLCRWPYLTCLVSVRATALSLPQQRGSPGPGPVALPALPAALLWGHP